MQINKYFRALQAVLKRVHSKQAIHIKLTDSVVHIVAFKMIGIYVSEIYMNTNHQLSAY